MEGSVAGVRILPAVVQFHDADPGVLHQMSLKVQNLSKFSKTVKFHVPDSKFFSVKVKEPSKPIAPGLDVTALVEYYTEKCEDCQDRAILVVDNDFIEIPLMAFTPCPQMEISGPVDLGCTVADGKVIAGYFSVDNYGSKGGEFKIKYNGNQPFTITPTSGIVDAETSQKIKVEFISKTCGKIKEILSVKLEGQENTANTVEILGNVVERRLELLTADGGKSVQSITFGPTYYGTDQVQSFTLYNNGPDVVSYVIILDEGAEGQEVGLDLTKNAMALVTSQPRSFSDDGDHEQQEDIRSLVTVFPNQGKLGPGETCVLNFVFSPRYKRLSSGWKHCDNTAPRKDYALFMNIEAVGSINKDSEGKLQQGCKLEVGVRGTAIPVDVSISPGTKFLFDECCVGEQKQALCSMRNSSAHLPITYTIHTVAHFHPTPLRGLLKAQKSSDIVICFKPHQIGMFNSKLQVDLLGSVLDKTSAASASDAQANSAVNFKQVVIHSFYMHVQGTCIPRDIKSATLQGGARVIMKELAPSSLSAGKMPRKARQEIAQPDDRATSIRPADRSMKLKTKFTGIERYSYIDPDFAHTVEEENWKQEHKQLYLDYIRDSRAFRELKSRKRDLASWENNKNLGIKPAHGLKPPKLCAAELASVSNKVETSTPLPGSRLLSTKSITTARKVVEGLNAIPLTDTEKLDCTKVLSPQDLRKIEIESAMINFGEVCQRSVKTKYLTVGNNLDQHIHIVVKIDCRELRQSSPLSQVIPPRSIARVNLLFESNSKGTFERSIDYTINDHHHFHVVATAHVVSVALELSCDKITLRPTSCMAVESGFRGVVTVKNSKNLAADFAWKVLNSTTGTSFSIRPAKGTVEAFSSLDCEVVFYPSFSCPKTTQFVLHVEGGNEPKLLCEAEFGAAQCSFIERRFMFGCVPLHLTTTRSCYLQNTGNHHAYFQIAQTELLAGMIVSPKEGVVPRGGTAEIKVEFTPSVVQKLDTEIEVNVLGWKTISLRVGGTVEMPCVDVDVGSFHFHGVYCEALAKIPFVLINKARSKAKVVFDLSRHQDFSLEFLDHTRDSGSLSPSDGVFTAHLNGLEAVDCVLKFRPSEVASYNFMLPVTINDTCAPCPSPSTIPPSPAPSKTNWTIPELDTPSPIPYTIPTPKRRVIATALRPPLQLSHTHLKFSLPPGYFDLNIESPAGRVQSCMLVNNSNKPCKWSLDLSSCSSLFKNDIFSFLQRSGSPFHGQGMELNNHAPGGVLQSGETFQLGVMFSPRDTGVHHASIPVILNQDYEKAYRVLELHAELLAPELIFKPKMIDFKVVPLAIENFIEFEILAKGYRRSCDVHYLLPEVEMSDGNRSCLLQCTFPKGTLITPCHKNEQNEGCRLSCRITFNSFQPVSFSSQIIFSVEKQSYYLPVRGTADNCLFTNYPFLAVHRDDYHIICQPKNQEKATNGDDNTSISTEAFLLPCITPTSRSQTLGSTSATSTAFGISTSSYEDSTTNMSSSLSDSVPSPSQAMIYNGITRQNELDLARDLDPNNLVPGATPQQSIFFKEILKTVQRWFSLQAWSSGPCPIKIPKYFQNSFQPAQDSSSNRSGNWDKFVKGDCRTIFQLVAHMCGRYIPGIPVNVALPPDRCDRVKKLHWMYSALLVFLRAQGALLAHVNPEDLMSFSDYTQWKTMKNNDEDDEKNVDRQNYERISCVAWTDLLLQLLKVFILGCVTPQQFKKVTYPPGDSGAPFVNPDPLSSNIYSVGERILLAWLNHHYKEQKQKTWGTRSLPSARWIVNFDLDFMDGLVLAALLAAHCPFLISSHLQDMFLHPTTAEQCLHNAVQVVEAFKVIHIDYDIVPTDITEANPVCMLLLCLHLYQHLPPYIPRATADFTGSLHSTITRHVQLQNPSSKPLLYTAVLCGPDASDFTIPMGDSIQVSPKSHVQLPVEFKSRFLRPCHATLVLIGKRSGATCGTTLVFTLRTCIDNITPRATIKCDSPLYEINKIELDISNPFHISGSFRLVLVEARGSLTGGLIKEKRTKSKTKKLVESKTDHGQTRKQKSSKKELILPETAEKKESTERTADSVEAMTRGFWCSSDTVHLEAHGHTKITVNFVPFQLGSRQCSVLLINEDIGEFLYLIETETTLPLPSRVPYVPSAHSVRVSSSLAALHGRGVFGGDDRVLYWKCDNNEAFTENIRIPTINVAKETALAAVGQQNMSRQELRRRQLTDTLNISSVTTAMSLLGLTPNYYVNMSEEKKPSNSGGHTTFKVESSSSHFLVPATIKIPFEAPSSSDSGTPLVVQFTPNGPGHYPTQITLKSTNDTRVYQIECTVSPGGLETALEFTTPLHQSVTQEIPLVNHTKQDWHLVASVEGDGFYGPPVMVAKGAMTSFYPLMFRPSYEGAVKGKLILTNTVDEAEHVYQLQGEGTSPMEFEHIIIECEARKKTNYKIALPKLKRKRTFNVASDLDIVAGLSQVTVLQDKNMEYELVVSPWKRGVYTGVVSFVATQPSRMPSTAECRYDDSDSSDDDQMYESSCYTPNNTPNTPSQALDDGCHSQTSKPYKFWYSVEIRACPPPPERVLDVRCAALSAVGVEITVSNPRHENVLMNVLVEGDGIFGQPVVELDPMQQTIYQAKYAPTLVGRREGSLIFQHENVGEFWYKLNLIAEQPEPKYLPTVQSELGSHSHQTIHLENPTNQTLLLTPYSSNQRNFALELDNTKQLTLGPHCTAEVPLRFTPSQIGQGNHKATIVFRSEQLGDWSFIASGKGLSPSPSKPLVVHGQISENSSLIVPFRNPTENVVIAQVQLRESDVRSATTDLLGRSAGDNNDPAFCLLLKQNDGIILKPQEALDIPLTFTPTTMKSYQATVTVTIQPYDQDVPHVSSLIHHLTWIFPVKGVPVSHVVGDSRAITVECQSRDRTEQVIELTLSGIVPSSTGVLYSTATPSSSVRQIAANEAELDFDNTPIAESFSYEFLYKDEGSQNALERSLGIQLEKKYCNKTTGVVTLIFRLVFSPYKPFSHIVHLILTAGSGGVWKFPVRFIATEADVDDTITVEAVGLNKEASLGFRLTSQCRQSIPFVASLAPDTDKEFSIQYSGGVLLPQDSEGTLIKIKYKPTLYGKIHKGKIIVQTADMQWTYALRGVPPDYSPPAGQSVIATKQTTCSVKQRKKNYVRDNLKLQTTGVSSPIKGASLTSRSRR